MDKVQKNTENADVGGALHFSEGSLRGVIAEILLTYPADTPLYRTAAQILEKLQ